MIFRADGIIGKILWWMDEHHLLVILPIIGILASVGIFVWSGVRSAPEPDPVSKDAKKGEYCSVEIQMLSDWILKVSGDDEERYYMAIDTDGEYYIVSMYESQFEEFSDIVAYTYAEEVTEVPKAKQVAGMITPLEVDEIESLTEVLEMSEEEYNGVFGEYFIDLKENPNTQLVGIFIWVLAVSLVFLVLKVFVALEERAERKKHEYTQIQ